MCVSMWCLHAEYPEERGTLAPVEHISQPGGLRPLIHDVHLLWSYHLERQLKRYSSHSHAVTGAEQEPGQYIIVGQQQLSLGGSCSGEMLSLVLPWARHFTHRPSLVHCDRCCPLILPSVSNGLKARKKQQHLSNHYSSSESNDRIILQTSQINLSCSQVLFPLLYICVTYHHLLCVTYHLFFFQMY